MEKRTSTIPADAIPGVLAALMHARADITIPVTGDSMAPLWRHKRDFVTLTLCDRDRLKKGDVPLYRRKNGQYVLHRIVRVVPGGYDLCGDAQVFVERGIPAESIIAVVSAFTRKGRNVHRDNPLYRLYSAVWPALRPLRRVAALPRGAARRLRQFFSYL